MCRQRRGWCSLSMLDSIRDKSSYNSHEIRVHNLSNHMSFSQGGFFRLWFDMETSKSYEYPLSRQDRSAMLAKTIFTALPEPARERKKGNKSRKQKAETRLLKRSAFLALTTAKLFISSFPNV